VAVRLVLMLLTVHTWPDTESHPDHPPNVEPFVGFAVSTIVLPVDNAVLHVDEQLRPGGSLVIVPVPAPAKTTVSACPVPVKQTTLAVIKPVMIAPDDPTLPALLVVTVAEMREPPHSLPVAVARPVEFTVTRFGVFDAQVTWLVMSLVTGG
jgi:hypothetical protein